MWLYKINYKNPRIYKVRVMVFLMVKMVKTQSQKKHPEKACFGTKEWSKNSGICKRCLLKDDCGKVEISRKVRRQL